MKIKLQEVDIPENNPFKNCKLNRKEYADVLTDIVANYKTGFVLAINNKWGTGKTTFVKMWQQHLKNKGLQTIYFNAWENDFDSNPMVALLSEFKSLEKGKNGKAFKTVLEKGAVLAKHSLGTLGKALLQKYTGIDEKFIDVIKEGIDASSEILQDEIEKYTQKKESIKEFRKAIESFVKKPKNDKPLIFIVDELDRCRPTYAIELLEQIKHLFSVSGIVFVLSIDKKHLASSVKGFYGSESINADEYLRRFIDLEYSIPEPSTQEWINYLLEYYSFNEIITTSSNNRRNDLNVFSEIAEYLFTKSKATLRQQEKIFALSRLVVSTYGEKETMLATLLFILIYIKVLHEDIYRKIEGKQYSLEELSNEFFNLVNSPINDTIQGNLIFQEAQLLLFYSNEIDITLAKELREGYKIESKLAKKYGINDLNDDFKSIGADFRHFKLSNLISKINLTVSFQF